MNDSILSGRLDRIEDKLDAIIERLGNLDGAKGFGVSLLANVVGNMLDGKK